MVTTVRRVTRAIRRSRSSATTISPRATTPGVVSRAPAETKPAVHSAPMTRWCHTSSIVSHDPKKLGPSNARLRLGAIALRAWRTPRMLTTRKAQPMAPSLT
jgi:hypothetical protein